MSHRLDPGDFNSVAYTTGKLITSIIQVASETHKRTGALFGADLHPLQ